MTVLSGMNLLLVLLRADSDRVQISGRRWLINGNEQLLSVNGEYIYLWAAVAVLVLISAWVVSYKIYEAFKPASYMTFVLAQIVLLINLLVSLAILST